MIPLGLIETWIKTYKTQDLIRAFVSLANLEGWTCTVRGKVISWAEWASKVEHSGALATNKAIAQVFFVCKDGKLDGDIPQELDLATCWTFAGDDQEFRTMWVGMLERQGALLGGITREQWLERYPRALSQYTL
jgi:hypothetical protein